MTPYLLVCEFSKHILCDIEKLYPKDLETSRNRAYMIIFSRKEKPSAGLTYLIFLQNKNKKESPWTY